MREDEKMNFKIPDYVSNIIQTLENNGYEAYIVGGCVRDILMGITPHDYDITTNALPQEIKSLFRITIDTGIKHGTVTVIIDNEPVEITTYRTEGIYSDNRRPDNINFVTKLSEDLSRRDFTVNAICYNESKGYVDLFGGKEDIENRILRAVGNPANRFREDSLRILRLFRFASTLGFKIETKTFEDAISYSNLIKNVSRERIAEELKKAVIGDDISILHPLINSNAFDFLSIKSCQNLTNVKKLQKKTDLRMFALLFLCNCDVLSVAAELKSSNKSRNYFEAFLNLNSDKIPSSKYEIKKIINRYGEEIFEDYLDFLTHIKNINCQNLYALLREIQKNQEPYSITQLDINGSDIISLGYKDKDIGETLNILLDEVMKNPSLNIKDELIKFLIK